MDLLDVPIGELQLSMRTTNCFRNEGIENLRQALALGADELMRIPNFGRKSVNEINDILSLHGVAKITGSRLRYFSIRLPEHVFAALERQARSNDRTTEGEACVVISTVMGEPPPAASLPERVAKLEAAMAGVCKGFGVA